MNTEEFIVFEKSAKLLLTEAERADMLAAADETLGRFGRLTAGIDTRDINPLVSVLDNKRNVLRDDAAVQVVGRDELFKRAPEVYDGCFVVPKT